MKKDDFPFTIGYSGDAAVIDSAAKKELKRAPLQELLEKGYYKTAFSQAIAEDDQDGLQQILDFYNQKSHKRYPNVEVLKKVFGVFSSPEGINKTIKL